MRPTPVRALGALAVAGSLALLAVALYLGFSIEGTDRAVADSERGQAVAYWAVPGLVAGIAGMAGARRSWGAVVAGAGVALAVVGAVVLQLGS